MSSAIHSVRQNSCASSLSPSAGEERKIRKRRSIGIHPHKYITGMNEEADRKRQVNMSPVPGGRRCEYIVSSALDGADKQNRNLIPKSTCEHPEDVHGIGNDHCQGLNISI